MEFENIQKKVYNGKKKKGYVLLVTVLVIGAVGLASTVSLLLLGLGSSRSSFAIDQSEKAKGLANACTEDALQKIRDTTSYVGTNNITLTYGSCSATVSNTGGENRTLTATGTVGTIVRKVSVTITAINPKIVVSSWQEVP